MTANTIPGAAVDMTVRSQTPLPLGAGGPIGALRDADCLVTSLMTAPRSVRSGLFCFPLDHR